MKSAIKVEGLSELRQACKAAQKNLPRALSKGIKDAGEPLHDFAASRTPIRTGRLHFGYAVRSSGATGYLTNRAPYGAGAEWGSHRKWSGFNRYGIPGLRFGGKGIEEDDVRDNIGKVLSDRLREIIEIYGWASPEADTEGGGE